MKPSSLRYRVLRLVVQNPGDLTAEQLAAHTCPPPKLAGPLPSRAAWNARALALELHEERSERKVRRALDYLTAKGLTAPCGAPVVSAWFTETMERRGLTAALERAHPAFPRDLPSLARHEAMVLKCTQRPESVDALKGPNPSGAVNRTYRDLSSWKVIVAPSQRVPTAAGVELVTRVAA